MSVLLLYQEMGINHDIISVAMTEARGSKILIAAGKIAVGVYNLSSRNVGFTAVHGEDPFAAAGLMNMRTPELRVDMIMFTTLAVHGGLVVHEDLYYYSSSNQASFLPTQPNVYMEFCSTAFAEIFAMSACRDRPDYH